MPTRRCSAICVDAATAASARLVELAADRDQDRAAPHAIAAIARLDPSHAVRAVRDPAAVVRVAAVGAATPAELAALAEDRDADVRAAGDRAPRTRRRREGRRGSTAPPGAPRQAVELAERRHARAARPRRLAHHVAEAATITAARRAGRGRHAATSLEQYSPSRARLRQRRARADRPCLVACSLTALHSQRHADRVRLLCCSPPMPVRTRARSCASRSRSARACTCRRGRTAMGVTPMTRSTACIAKSECETAIQTPPFFQLSGGGSGGTAATSIADELKHTPAARRSISTRSRSIATEATTGDYRQLRRRAAAARSTR